MGLVDGFQSPSQPEGIVASPTDEDPFLAKSIELGADKLKVYVFDSLFEKNTLAGLYNKFRSLTYHLGDYDRDDTQFVKHLVHEFTSEEVQATRFLQTIICATRELADTQGIKVRNPVKVYANFNLYGDYQFDHEDGDVWTVLVFVNASWDDDWGGELLLYDGTFAADNDRGFAYAINPRPGRMVIFDGRIKHRGGVPSKFCLEPRISLAIKFLK